MRRPLVTRRAVAVAACVATLAVAGWWFVRAPAVERGRPAALPPEPDIEPPAMRARREAAIALAEMPADPWTLAESLAASGAASAAEPAKENCGQDDAPQFGRSDSADAPPAQTRAASPGYLATQARIDAALRGSGDPFDRALADLLNVGDMRSEGGAAQAVVRQAAASTDPRVYALGYGLCRTPRAPADGCEAFTPQRWAELDPGNGIPWIEILAQAQARGNADGVRAAMARLATAASFDTRFAAPAEAVLARLPDDPRDLTAVADLTTQAIGTTLTLPGPPYQALTRVCHDGAGGDASLAQACRAVSDAMFEHSADEMSRLISGAVLFQATGDPSRRDAVRAERAVFLAHWSPATGFSPCGTLRDQMKKLRRIAQVGEVEAMREQARQFVPP